MIFFNKYNKLKEFSNENKKIILNLLIERVFVDKSTVEIKLRLNFDNSVGSQYGAPSDIHFDIPTATIYLLVS